MHIQRPGRVWTAREEERGSALENSRVQLRSLVLIADPVYNMTMNKSFRVLMSFVCSPTSLISVYRFTELLPNTRNV